jgi:DNA helicase-2/ATP-dependent DNA helicase PcrA
MLGPSSAFLQYIRNLLPSLGQQDIPQTTVRDWLVKSFSISIRIDRSNRFFRQLMSNRGRPSSEEYEAELFKGSTQIAEILERQVKAFRETALSYMTEMKLALPGGGLYITPENEVRRLARSTYDLPLNKARGSFIEGLINLLWSKSKYNDSPNSFRNFATKARPLVENLVNRFWPERDFQLEYMSLLSDVDGLISNSRGAVSQGLAKALAESLPEKGETFSDTDLAPLLYQDHLLNERPNQAFEHIVLDEAQDLSPLEILLLKRHSKNGWFTILRDIRQRLLPYRGVSNWRQVSVLFDQKNVARYESRTSYRCTYQITRFCNRILRRIRGSTAPPIPFDRQGEEPLIKRSQSSQAMLEAIRSDIDLYKGQGVRSIGVLCKWNREAKIIFEYLKNNGVEDVRLLEPTGFLIDEVTVSPVLLTKGLEFDAVILAGVHASNFRGSDLDNRVLYLACTCPRHRLSLHWFGQISPTLSDMGIR